MAVLSSGDRTTLWSDYMRETEAGEVFGITKADLKAAIDATDDWIDANAASYNSALPQPARSSLTARQKARLLMYVIRRRFSVS